MCAEALTNVAKYARASRVAIEVRREPGRLVVAIADDGVGGADPAAGRACAGLADRDLGDEPGPRPARAVHAEPAAERLDAVGEPTQAGAAARVGAADAVVDDRDQSGRAVAPHLDRHREARAYFATFVSASAHTK